MFYTWTVNKSSAFGTVLGYTLPGRSSMFLWQLMLLDFEDPGNVEYVSNQHYEIPFEMCLLEKREDVGVLCKMHEDAVNAERWYLDWHVIFLWHALGEAFSWNGVQELIGVFTFNLTPFSSTSHETLKGSRVNFYNF